MRKYLAVITAVCIFTAIGLYVGSGGQKEKVVAAPNDTGGVVIEFDYQKQSGFASNQFAVWIEDESGKLIKTLCATAYTAEGGYAKRPDSISLWVKKSMLSTLSEAQVDAFSSATPQSGHLSYIWDLTDESGNKAAPGKYKFFVEGTLRMKNRVLYTGVIPVGDKQEIINAAADFYCQGADSYPALNANSPENSMITKVTAKFTPAAAK